MKAIVQYRYGSAGVLSVAEVDRPEIDPESVLVRVRASSVNPADWHTVTGLPYVMRPVFGLRRPKLPVPGRDVAGVVEAVGDQVTGIQPGDDVYGELNGGAYAEYACAPQKAVARMPANLSYEQAAAVPLAGITALQALRDHGKVTEGQRVLINGASGGVGSFAVQVAKALGAEVTAVCSTRNAAWVRSIGADHVIDYTTDDLAEAPGGYDVLLDLIGNHSLGTCRRLLKRTGVYLPSTDRPGGNWVGPIPFIISRMARSMVGRPKAAVFVASTNPDDLAFLTELIESGKLTPVIDRQFTLDQVPDAIAYQAAGHAQGKSIITI